MSAPSYAPPNPTAMMRICWTPSIKSTNAKKPYLCLKLSAWAELNNKQISDLTVAIWGLAFKPNTDDTRESLPLDLIKVLIENGATVRANDPKAIEETKHTLGDLPNLTYHDDPMATCDGADVLCLMTEWRPYRPETSPPW